MVMGKKRDEWDRFGQLMSLIHERTSFASGEKRKLPDEFWPKELVTDRDRQQLASLPKPQPLMRLNNGKELQQWFGLVK